MPHDGGIMRDPIYCWLVTNGDTHVLVDTGMPAIEVVRKTLRVDGYGGGHKSLNHGIGRRESGARRHSLRDADASSF